MDKNTILICNTEKQNTINNKILDRTFNIKNRRVNLIDHRSDHKICGKYTDINKDNKHLTIDYNTINSKNDFFPGNGSSIGFLKNIDIDSKVKNIGDYNTLCQKTKTPKLNDRLDKFYKNPLTSTNSKLWNNVSKRKCCK